MKRIPLFFLLTLTSCCLVERLHVYDNKQINIQSDKEYEIYKIDSIGNYYLIYALKGDSLFKIVSVKETASNCTRIQLGHSYKIKFFPSANEENLIDLGGIIINDSTIIDIERDSILELSFAKNINGLCISEE